MSSGPDLDAIAIALNRLLAVSGRHGVQSGRSRNKCRVCGTDQASLVGIAPAVTRTLSELPGPVLLQAPSYDFLWGLAVEGVLLLAVHAGIDARLPTDLSADVAENVHTLSAGSARSTVLVVVGDSIESYRDLSVANADPSAWFDAHQPELSRIHKLDARGPAIALFLKTA